MTTNKSAAWLLGFFFLLACGDEMVSPQVPDPAGPPPYTPGPGIGPIPSRNPLEGVWTADYGLAGLSGGSDARVVAFHTDAEGQLVAAGTFSYADGVNVSNVARLTDRGWEPLGELPPYVMALGHDADGALLAGGAFHWANETNALMRYDGDAWEAISPGFDGRLQALARTPGGTVLIGGDFPASASVPGNGLVGLVDGELVAVAGDGVDGVVRTFLVNGSGYCAAGGFSTIAGVAANNVACFDGSDWTQLGDGLPGEVLTLVRDDDGRLLAGGTFVFEIDPAWGIFRTGLAWLDGDSWRPLYGGVNDGYINSVRSIVPDGQGGIYVGGQFRTVGEDEGVVVARHVAHHDGSEWRALGEGVANQLGVSSLDSEGVHAMTIADDGRLLTGGHFSWAGDIASVNIAAWADDDFTPVRPHTSVGVSGLVDHVAPLADGSLVIGGWFSHVGGTSALNVARIDAEGKATAFGPGLDDVVRVTHVAADGAVWAGGDFLGDGTNFMQALARWDGDSWASVGGASPDGPVLALVEADDGDIYIGGDFERIGTLSARRVARWDGESWHALGDGFDLRVTALALDAEGRLVAGGLFTESGGKALAKIARFDGTAWTAVGAGLEGEEGFVNALVRHGEHVLVGGWFTAIDGEPAAGLARIEGDALVPVLPGVTFQDDVISFVSGIAPYKDGYFITGMFDRAGEANASFVAYHDGETWHALADGIADIGETVAVTKDGLMVGGPFLQASGLSSVGLARWSF